MAEHGKPDPEIFRDIVESLNLLRPALDQLKIDLYEAGEVEAHLLVLELVLVQAKLAFALGGLAYKYRVEASDTSGSTRSASGEGTPDA